jgi:hypothetical protein
MFVASLWYIVQVCLGFFAGLLHKGLFIVALVGSIIYFPHAASVVYQADLQLLHLILGFIPGVEWVATKFTMIDSWLGSAGKLTRMDPDWIDRLKLALFIPWTPPGWLFLIELYMLVGAILNIPAFLLERNRKRREIDLQDELRRTREEAQKWRPREGEILLPEKNTPTADLPAPRRLLSLQK